MPASTTFDHLLAIVRAGATVVHVASYEWERVRGHVIGLSRELSLPLRIWSSSAGLLACDERGATTAEDDRAVDPIEVLRQLHQDASPGALLLEDVHPYLEPQHHQVTRWVREMCRVPPKPRKLVVLSTPLAGLPVDLRKEVPSVELPLPDVDDLRTVCEDAARELDVPLDRAADEVLEAARGLTIMEARLAFGQAAIAHRRLGRDAVPIIVHEKERIIRQSEVLEFHEPQAGMADVGGLENLKEWLDRRGRAFGAGAREYGLDAPKGVMLLGVQGCGKSLVAKAVAAAWQFPLLRFDMGRVFGGLVGQSEGNIRSALHVAQALAPCVLWIDEIEKGLAGMSSSDVSDAGTTARVAGTLLTWMQEKSAPVFVVATANRVELLPPELLRKGRFDEIFFVDLPTRRVREEILGIHLRRKRRDPRDFDLAALAEASAGCSGAEIEEAVREGLFSAFAAGEEIRTRHVVEALQATYPLSRTMREPIEELRRWAKVRARLASREDPEPVPGERAESVPRLKQEARNPFIPQAKA
ncbi:AAA family ATPase [Sorangium sp. So ce388]|uniref:AAA family ATPase n=1 Tax=Sorangium sp. So ce388 TaxID=3133309 RepID=UPI003F5C6823